jgi:hypothetical protein
MTLELSERNLGCLEKLWKVLNLVPLGGVHHDSSTGLAVREGDRKSVV